MFLPPLHSSAGLSCLHAFPKCLRWPNHAAQHGRNYPSFNQRPVRNINHLFLFLPHFRKHADVLVESNPLQQLRTSSQSPPCHANLPASLLSFPCLKSSFLSVHPTNYKGLQAVSAPHSSSAVHTNSLPPPLFSSLPLYRLSRISTDSRQKNFYVHRSLTTMILTLGTFTMDRAIR